MSVYSWAIIPQYRPDFTMANRVLYNFTTVARFLNVNK